MIAPPYVRPFSCVRTQRSHRWIKRGIWSGGFAAAVIALGCLTAASAQQPAANATAQQRAASLQQELRTSQAQLRGYDWIETTVVAKDGAEKSRKQNRVFYGADGKPQKVPMDGGVAAEGGRERVLGKRIKENVKESTAAYLQDAVQLVHSYVPPDPAKLQLSISAGKMSVSPTGSQLRLDFKDYMKAGDLLSVRVEAPTNRLLGIGVATYLDTPSDAVKLNVDMGVLPDGTIYTAKTVLYAEAKGLTVTIENTGYRKMAQ